VSGRRHLRLVAIGDDVDPPMPAPPRRRRRDAELYEATLAELSRRGWHGAVAAIEAALTVDRRQAADDHARRETNWRA
jgi:hypothetical protein